MYFFTSAATARIPVAGAYKFVSLEILALLAFTCAVATALFLADRSVCLVVRVTIFKSISFGA